MKIKPLEELCEQAEKIPNTTRSYKCVSEDECPLRTDLFGTSYCKFPLDPEKYAKDLPKNNKPSDHYLKYFKYGEGI